MTLPKNALPLAFWLALGLIRLSLPLASGREANAEPRFSGIPLYQIFDESSIGGSAKANFLTSSADNTIYFGNENGIYAFDNSSWRQVIKTTGSTEKIRSIAWADQTIYAAGYGTVGELTLSETNGQPEFHSYNDEPLTRDASEFYQKIHKLDDKVFYIGTRSVIIHDLKTGANEAFPFDTWIRTSFIDGEKLYLSTHRDGMWKFEDGHFVVMTEFATFHDKEHIVCLAKGTDGQIAFATESGALYSFADEKATPAFPLYEPKKHDSISNMAFTHEGHLALAIPGEGILFLGEDGSLVSSLDKGLDYRWAGIRDLHVDRFGTLWTLFDAAVGKVLSSSPITTIDDRLRPNLIYATAHQFDKHIYLSNNGKLYRSKHGPNGRLEGFEDALSKFPEKSIVTAEDAPDGLYLHSQGTTFLFRDDRMIPMLRHGRLDRIVSFQDGSDLLLGVSSSTIKLFRRTGDRLSIEQTLPHTAGLVNKVACDRNNVFWLEIGLGKIGRVWLENDKLHFKLYDSDDGVPADWFAVWEHEGDVLFTERTGVFRFDSQKESFSRIPEWDAYFPPSAGPIHRLATDPQGNIWASHANTNIILWKQADGSFHKDTRSLSNLGSRFFNEWLFLPDGNVAFLSANEMFHFDAAQAQRNQGQSFPRSKISVVSNIEGTQTFLSDLSKPNLAPLSIDRQSKGIVVRLANNYSGTLTAPKFQYFLVGLSQNWSQWGPTNELSFTNLSAGPYQLLVRTLIEDQHTSETIQLPFRIKPAPWESAWAYSLYTALTGLALYLAYRFLSKNLQTANERLEAMVAERTREIELKNGELERQAGALSAKNSELARKSIELQRNSSLMASTLDELRRAQDQLMTTSRKAGMAEVATNVLHNVGNVLNSVNVTMLSLARNLANGRVDKFVRISKLIADRKEVLPEFLTEDPKGRAIPEYLDKLSQTMREDLDSYLSELDYAQDNIEHIKKIIATQQAHAKTVDVYQDISLPQLVDSATTMIMGDIENHIFEITRQYDDDLRIVSDKHRILQMVANFIKNAKEAIRDENPPLGMINIEGRFIDEGNRIRLSVRDNGTGISAENLKSIFTHGFTTKDEGHGFGMHSCANSAKVLGGTLQIESDGLGKGATVILELPVKPPQKLKPEQELPPKKSPKRPKRSALQALPLR